MNRLTALAAAAVAAMSLALLPAAASAASPGPAASPAGSPSVRHLTSLHADFLRLLKSAKAGRIAGRVPAVGAKLSTAGKAPAPASCTEPNCNLLYGGGPVQHTPHVYLLLWGPNWTATNPGFELLDALYKGLGVLPDDTWSSTLSQYHDGSGAPTFGKSVFAGAFSDTSTPPSLVTPDVLAAEADAFVTAKKVRDVADVQIVIASQAGTCFSDGFVGSCGTINTTTGTYCAWHSMTTDFNVPFTNMPYVLDAGSSCGENFINSGTAGQYDGFSLLAGHEYAESVTDPTAGSGWLDGADTVSGGEVADKCVWGGGNWGPLGSDPYGDFTLSTGSFAMQSLWSNSAGRCVMATTPSLTVTSPGTQRSTLGVRVTIHVHAVTNAGVLHYTATGLPPGLSIDKGTGVITGTPATTAGTFTTHVTVSEYAGSKAVSFRWQVGSRAGAVKGYHGLCADDFNGRKTNGNKIDVWRCDGLTRQKITFTASGELTVAGKCITSGHGVVLEPCTGSAVQTWTRRANGEYVVKGRCLTDPRNSTKDGTQLGVNVCTNSPSQRWSLP